MAAVRADHKLVVLSNRGPVAWRAETDGTLRAGRGAGGLVTALVPALESAGGVWIAAAMSDTDRRATREGLVATDDAYEVRLLEIDTADLHAYLDVVSNQILWYAHHDLWNRPREPVVDDDMYTAWDCYVRVNELFASEALTAIGTDPAVVLVQDYHLALTPALIRAHRPDVRVAHFSHTPFAPPSSLAVLPGEWAARLLSSMAEADICGFHTDRWAHRFRLCLDDWGVTPRGRTEVFPLGPDVSSLRAQAGEPAVASERAALETQLDGRRAVVRVDRAEPSKNVLRGLAAFDALLHRRPDLAHDVAHVVLLNPSRQALAQYRAYLQDCISAAESINARVGREAVILHAEDRYARSIAAFTLADVIVVNPISDGMNLVAKEGPLLNERDAPLILSTEAGAHAELATVALSLNPYDVSATAAAMSTALDMGADERGVRAHRLRELAAAHPPADWLDAQLVALGVTP
ncbi:MAG: trehalose-6-phosphate synthase [Acidimicrobiia bacterium]|nr:trehalose-6-phosphate synthase [Acidimicrobiia bacterium]